MIELLIKLCTRYNPSITVDGGGEGVKKEQ